MNIFAQKQIAIVPTSTAKNASSFLTPQAWMNKKVNVSKIVMIAPSQIGNPNKILNAIAVPMTSWISLPMIAISVITQSIIDIGLGNCSLQSTARSRPVTIPILTLSIWITNPQNVARKSAQISPYPP
jgi:hypothetical protein